MVVFLIGVSNILGWVMAFTQIPQAVSAALLGFTSSPAALLLIMNAVLLLAGTFMDVTPAILIFTPLFLPVVEAFGMHPVQFGLILVYNLCIGNITPPVGNTLFVAIKVGKTSLSEVMPYMLWYYGAILSGLLLVTFVPAVSLGLGNTLFVAIKVGKTSLSEVMPYMLWYYGAILSGLLLVTFVPAVSLGLPWLTGVLK